MIKSEKILMGTWLNYKKQPDSTWIEFFKKLTSSGISHFFIHASAKELHYLLSLTKNWDIKIHGWVWAFNRPNDKKAMKNLDWYSINRKGDNSYDTRPYVDYYQWLSPFSSGATNHIKNNIKKISEVKGIASVHIDYVRYCDVFLPSTLQKKYKIEQREVLHEYDYGYHKNGRRQFLKLHGVDPININNASMYDKWIKFRHNAITKIVKELKVIANNNGTNLSAAVFPTPEMSKRMVLQDWASWNIDMVCPMNYHHFYGENIDWIGKNVRLGLKEINPECIYLSGIYAGSLSPNMLGKAIKVSLENNASGVNFFSASNLSNEHLKVIKTFK
jgi:uncharacterized lipoprotein YddW (UPF0748 family)